MGQSASDNRSKRVPPWKFIGMTAAAPVHTAETPFVAENCQKSPFHWGVLPDKTQISFIFWQTPMFEFPCPYCSTKLRLQDRALRGRTVDCPDCTRPVLIQETSAGLQGVVVNAPASAAPKPPVAATVPPALTSPFTPHQLQRAIWGAAAVAFTAILTYLLWPDAKHQHPVPAPAPAAVTPERVAPAPENSPPKPEVPLAAQHLELIAGQLQQYTNQHSTYPGTSTDGLSWLGELQRLDPAAPPYQPHRAWDDPINDPFVRRRLNTLQNPLIPQLVGEDGYPATHFAGVAGVGDDAHKLPASHPRAGIFGTNRVTTPEDVKDGLANTLMVVGVQQQLGSWAAPGTASLRPFSQEPYINGPDGMGTGQPDGMYALMADGSVRFLSTQTDPVILRRLAAMADGYSLDPNEPGDPLAMEVRPAVVAPPVAVPLADQPILVELAPNPPPYNVQTSLSQKLVRFQQTRPLTLKALLIQWSELAALPIDISLVPADRLTQEHRHDLSDVTLQQLLEQLIDPAELTAEYDDRFGVKLAPR